MLRALTHKIWTLLLLPVALFWIGTACSSESTGPLDGNGGTNQPQDRDTDDDGLTDDDGDDDDDDGTDDESDDDDDGDGIPDDQDDDDDDDRSDG
jgi:hypothetical protein